MVNSPVPGVPSLPHSLPASWQGEVLPHDNVFFSLILPHFFSYGTWDRFEYWSVCIFFPAAVLQ